MNTFVSPDRSNVRRKRVLLSMLVLGTLTTIVGVATFADFNASTNYTGQTFATSHIQINNNNQNDGTSLSLSLSNMIPGDNVTKVLNVVNTGDTDILNYSLSTVATTSSALNTGSPSPLRVWISRCTVAWTGTACTGGTATDIVGTSAAPVSVIFSNQSMATPGGGTGIFCKQGYSQHATRGVGTCDINNVANTDYLKIQVSLASTGATGAGADNALQGLSSTVSFDFSGQQPAAHSF